MEPSVTAMCSQDRKVRSLAKKVLGSMRIIVPWGVAAHSTAQHTAFGFLSPKRQQSRSVPGSQVKKVSRTLVAVTVPTHPPVPCMCLGVYLCNIQTIEPNMCKVCSQRTWRGGGGGPLGPSSFLRKPSCWSLLLV
jgi:hypothetical protein